MTGPAEIIDAISRLAVAGMPELKAIYTELEPQDIERPCLLIETDSEDERTAAAAMVDVTAYFTLTLFDETDDYSHSDTARLLRMRSKLLQLFRPGFLKVGDRALSVKASSAGRDWDKAFLDLQFEYMEARFEEIEPLPAIESVETNLTMKG